MQRSKQMINLKFLLLVLLSVVLGLAIHFANPATALVIFFLWAVAAFSSLTAIVTGLFRKKFRLLYLIGFLPFITGYGYESVSRHFAHEKAVKLNSQIERYRSEHGKYPGNLYSLDSTIRLSGLIYTTSSDYTNYRIEYLMDQFNREYFDSKSKSWGTLGWND